MICDECNKEFTQEPQDYCSECLQRFFDENIETTLILMKRVEFYKSQLKIALEGLELIASGRAVANDMSSFGKKFEDLQICARTTIKNIDEVGNDKK